MPISAYLSVFDDWDLLGPAVASVAPMLDEIVVADGAYRWMAPALEALGRDPTKSDPHVAEALAPFPDKVRFVNGLWDDESQKRAAAYAACSHRWIMRIDADEILFPDHAALERFFASGKAVAEIEIPLYLAPGWIRTRCDEAGIHAPIERLPVLFDRNRISARDHLSYLWLFVSEAEKTTFGRRDPDLIHPDTIAFAAHLTHWRSARTAVNRARFYVTNYLREHRPEDLSAITDVATVGRWMDSLLGHVIVVGLAEMKGHTIRPTPLTDDQDASFAPFYDRYLDSLVELNAALAQTGRTVAAGEFQHIDLSTTASRNALGMRGDVLKLESNKMITAAEAEIVTLGTDPAGTTEVKVEPIIDGRHLLFTLPDEVPPSTLRRVLRLRCWDGENTKWLHLRATPA